jgi:hypothetical protein
MSDDLSGMNSLLLVNSLANVDEACISSGIENIYTQQL